MGGVNQYGGGGTSRRAFTVIELLVVISIIVVLLAILLPALHRAQEQARAVVCQSNLRQSGIFLTLYTAQNDEKFFQNLPVGSGIPGWYWPMWDYFAEEPEILLCPSAKVHRRLPDVDPDWGGGSRTAWEFARARASYGTNHWITAMGEDRRHHPWASWAWETPSIRGASQAPVFLECMFGGGSPLRFDGPPIDHDTHVMIKGECNTAHFCINRHKETVNGLFMDGAVRKVGLKELWTLKWHRQYDTAGPWTRAGGVEPADWPVWMRKFQDY